MWGRIGICAERDRTRNCSGTQFFSGGFSEQWFRWLGTVLLHGGRSMQYCLMLHNLLDFNQASRRVGHQYQTNLNLCRPNMHQHTICKPYSSIDLLKTSTLTVGHIVALSFQIAKQHHQSRTSTTKRPAITISCRQAELHSNSASSCRSDLCAAQRMAQIKRRGGSSRNQEAHAAVATALYRI